MSESGERRRIETKWPWLLWHATAKGCIRALLIPDSSRSLTTEQALTHSWLTSFAAPTEVTEHDRSAREF